MIVSLTPARHRLKQKNVLFSIKKASTVGRGENMEGVA
jgi:hypothetical protein